MLKPLWYKDAVVYELHVRAFHDSNGDGIGDFVGLTEKLDYLQDLGVTALWLLPFYPSPLRDDGYDIADYTNVHPNYGTLDDFRRFLDAAHARGLQVITELVINHTSDQHPWFQRARRSPPGSVERDFYIWSDTPNKYADVRVIFQDFEPSNWTFDHVAGAYYMHRFYSHQPDLNYDNPAVHDAVLPLLDFWLGLGVDGVRLDAIPYLYKREGTTCENLPETHAFLKKLRRHADEKFPHRMFLAEANMWPEDAIAYFGDGDECHMAFHFPLMPRMFIALRMEDRFPIVDILEQTPAIPSNCQWALFLRNHDELTLEMVTDEERDYMYRAYAGDPRARINLGIRRRLAPLLGNDRRRIELMHGLLFSLPGTPVLYYGDEIGMGDNIFLGDRNGVRTPMQWSADRNAGFSRANAQRLYLPVNIDPEYHYESNNVEAQQHNPHSLLWWVKRLLTLRKRVRAFGRGSLRFLTPDNTKVLAFLRGEELPTGPVLVVANLSRFPQFVELDLSEYRGRTPIELFGQTPFPTIAAEPYRLTLGPHSFLWFQLSAVPHANGFSSAATLTVEHDWTEAFSGSGLERLTELLPAHLEKRRWFRGGGRIIRGTRILETMRLGTEPDLVYLLGLRVDYVEGESEFYLLPLTFADTETARDLERHSPRSIMARISGGRNGVLHDAQVEPAFRAAWFELLNRSASMRGTHGEFRAIRETDEPLPSGDAPPVLERGHLSFYLPSDRVLRLHRRVLEGVHPDVEFRRHLQRTQRKAPVTPLLATMEYQIGSAEPATLAVLCGETPSTGDAWPHFLAGLGHYFERAAVSDAVPDVPRCNISAIVEAMGRPVPDLLHELLTPALDDAHRLGETVADFHWALASPGEAAFAPESLTAYGQRALVQTFRNHISQALQRLRTLIPKLPEPMRELARSVVELRSPILARFQSLRGRKLGSVNLRVHGELHLGQFVRLGSGFLISRFEGRQPGLPSARRIKRPALRDVADVLASLWRAASVVLEGVPDDGLAAIIRGEPGSGLRGGQSGSVGLVRPEDRPRLHPWRRAWSVAVGAAFLRAYFQRVGDAPFLPPGEAERRHLLEAFLVQRQIFEIDWELPAHPDRFPIHVQILRELLSEGDS